MTSKTSTSHPQRSVLIVLTLALAAWGTYHALGSYFGGFDEENLRRDFRRSLVVFATMAAFLGFWWLMILRRDAQNSRTKEPPQTKN